MKFSILLLLQLTFINITTKAQTVTSVASSCNYFPVKNGLKLVYKRTNMIGEQTITETYTAVKDKTLKSGKLIKGYRINSSDENRNNTIIYYYCENNSVKMYSEMPSYNTQVTGYVEDYSILPSDYNKPDHKKTPIWETEKTGSGKYLTFTELKDGKVGDTWTDIQIVNDNPITINGEILETDLTLTVNEQTYSSVIHIKRTTIVQLFGTAQILNTQNVYYAKGIGKIKMEENGQDILMGSYTTTQELISHNLTPQANNAKNSVPNKVAPKTPSYKLGANAIESMCNNWCGSYKLIEKNGKAVNDFPDGVEYLHLETEGDAVMMVLKNRNGKLYETGKETDLGWSVWMENNQQVIYIRTASEPKGKPVSINSIPRKKLIYDNKVYEYVKREVEYY